MCSVIDEGDCKLVWIRYLHYKNDISIVYFNRDQHWHETKAPAITICIVKKDKIKTWEIKLDTTYIG